MAISGVDAVEDIVEKDGEISDAILELIDAKVEERVAEEAADLRQELAEAEAERDELREKVDNQTPLTAFRVTIGKIAEELSGQDIDDYTVPPRNHLGKFAATRDDINDLLRTMDKHDSALDSLGHGKPEGKDDAWQRIVTTANNLHGNSENTVNVDGRYDAVLYWKDIQSATGYSERYCKKLISIFGDEDSDDKKRGANCEDYEPPSPQNDHNARRKRLYIDLDVWSNDAQ